MGDQRVREGQLRALTETVADIRDSIALGLDSWADTWPHEEAPAHLAPPAGPPSLVATHQEWQRWWGLLWASGADQSPEGALRALRRSLPGLAARLATARGSADHTSRRRALRAGDFSTFFARLKGGGDATGLRPSRFYPAPDRASGRAPGPRPCLSDAEVLEAADQEWAWMHDEQPTFPRPGFLREVEDPALPPPLSSATAGAGG